MGVDQYMSHRLAFTECHIVGIIHYVALSDWLISLRICSKGSYMIFNDLIDHFILTLNNMPLFACTTVYLSIHPLKGMMVPSKFWQFQYSSCKHNYAGFCVYIGFYLLWLNAKEHDCCII